MWQYCMLLPSSFGNLVGFNMERAHSTIVRFSRSATPFCCGVHGAVMQSSMPLLASSSETFLLSNSFPPSHLSCLITCPICLDFIQKVLQNGAYFTFLFQKENSTIFAKVILTSAWICSSVTIGRFIRS